jgi:peptide/nickel transport system substrate-binding protein
LFVFVFLFVLSVDAPNGLGQPKKGGTLTMGFISEPSSLDSCNGAWNAAPTAANLQGGILETNENMETAPGLAESWSVDYKNKKYIFNIRKGVKWHDGKPFTVQDVKFSFETFLPAYDNRGVYLKDTKANILSDTRVEIIPGSWAPGIQLDRMASVDWALYPKHILEGVVDFPKSSFRRAPIGTGPFKAQEWVRGSHITFVRNDEFWKPNKPYLDKVVIKIIQDPAMLLAALTTGEADFVFRGLPYEAYETLKKNPNLQVIVDYKPNYKLHLGFNMKHAILSNPMVRKAIAHAINKKDIAAKATSNVCRPSDRVYAPELLPVNTNLPTYPYDPKKAEEMLDQAGYPRKSGGIRFPLLVIVRTGEAEEEKTADLLRENLKAVGIDLTLKKGDFNTILQLEGNYQFDLTLVKRWIHPIYDYQQHHSAWIRPGTVMVNVIQYSNPKADYWYDQWAYHATSDEDRTKALLNAEKIITEDLPDIPLFDTAWMYIWSKRVGNAFVPSRNWIQSEPYDNVYIK